MALSPHGTLAGLRDQLYLYIHHGRLPFAILISPTKIMTIEYYLCYPFLLQIIFFHG